ncbi:rab-GTPase-TBC domain-containing protein [Scheffersomyces amazonensis]|uniref:rab-GTPase-TBC domain-containing protein n=1 Tax=Scheffersomyces amazonensis TaxID=1078765 RepID=UPI00315DAA51
MGVSNRNRNYSNPITNNTESLFPLDNDDNPLFSITSASNQHNEHSDKVHELKVAQIQRLIQLKYRNDPIKLIKQLSYELSKKESELVLIQQQNFIKQQKLIRLCIEFSNLSTLEINQRLNEMDKDNEGNAVSLNRPQPIIDDNNNNNNNNNDHNDNHNDHNDDTITNNHNTKNVSSVSSLKSITTIHEHDLLAPTLGSTHSQLPIINQTIHHHSQSSPSPISSNWLTKWFNNSTDDLSSSLPHLKRSSSTPPINGNENTTLNSHTNVKVPVELESMSRSDTSVLSESEPNPSLAINIDKYGFFNDLNNITTTTTTISSTPPPVTQSPPQSSDESSNSLSNSIAILIQNKNPINQTINHLRQISKTHDITNQQIENEWDLLIRDINREFYRRQQQQQEQLQLQQFQQSNNEDSKFFRSINKIKNRVIGSNTEDLEMYGLMGLNLVKHDETNYIKLLGLIHKSGILIKYRNQLWYEFSNGKNLCVNGEYQELLNRSKTKSEIENDLIISKNIEQINLDLHRTLPSNYYFNNLIELKPGPNFYKLQRILYAFIVYKPEIGYYQGMNKLVANLLLLVNQPNSTTILLKEEDIFWIFIGIIEEILPRYYNPIEKKYELFYQSFSSIQIDLKIVNHIYIKKYLSKLYGLFDKLNVDVEIIILNWWLSLFIDLNFLDLDVWFKIFDVLLIHDDWDVTPDTSSTVAVTTTSTSTSTSSSIPEPISADDNNQSSSSIEVLPNVIKFFALTLSMLKILENYLLALNDHDLIYKYLSYTSSTDNNNISTLDKFKIKYSELIKSYQYFTKRISKVDVSNYRKHKLKIN